MSSFVSLNYHIVFSTKNRELLIDEAWEKRLFDYIGGIVRAQDGRLIEAGGVRDHIHLLTTIHQSVAIANLVRDIKANSSKWVHDEISDQTGFAWQSGYGAFTVSCSAIERVRKYIANQKEHHRKRTFQDEFRALLRRHKIEFDERYVWD